MCNCVVEVTAKVASHLESQGVEIVDTPVMVAAIGGVECLEAEDDEQV